MQYLGHTYNKIISFLKNLESKFSWAPVFYLTTLDTDFRQETEPDPNSSLGEV